MDKVITAINAFAFCTAYTLLFSLHFRNKKLLKYFFVIILLTELICKLWLTELISVSFYICCIVASLFIRRDQNLLKGINISLAILRLFVWGISLMGCVVFLIFPDRDLYLNIPYNLGMASWLLFFAIFVRRYQNKFFNITASDKLIQIDTMLSLTFILFINLLLPDFFIHLGRTNYAKICLVILLNSAFSFIHKTYTISLEKKAETDRWNALLMSERAMFTVEKAKETISLRAKYSSQDKTVLTDIKNSGLLQKVHIPVIQAMIYEVMDKVNKHGSTLDLIADEVQEANIGISELVALLNAFQANINTILDVDNSSRTLKIRISNSGEKFSFSTEMACAYQIEVRGLDIVKTIGESYSNIPITVGLVDSVFYQEFEIIA